MKARKRMIFVALASAGLATAGAAGAANAPAVLSDNQLDSVSAGALGLTSSADAVGVGAFTMGGTTTTAVASGGATQDQPGLVSGAGLADGVAIGVGTNFGQSSAPAGSATSVQTGGTASGSAGFTSTVNATIHSAGGVTMQVGWTYVMSGNFQL